jgi:hypothetical protein
MLRGRLRASVGATGCAKQIVVPSAFSTEGAPA